MDLDNKNKMDWKTEYIQYPFFKPKYFKDKY